MSDYDKLSDKSLLILRDGLNHSLTTLFFRSSNDYNGAAIQVRAIEAEIARREAKGPPWLEEDDDNA